MDTDSEDEPTVSCVGDDEIQDEDIELEYDIGKLDYIIFSVLS